MSSKLRSIKRNMVRCQVETENAPQRTRLRQERKTPTEKLGIERNIVLFKDAWFKCHYKIKETVNENGDITTMAKRKKIQRFKPHISKESLISRLKFAKALNKLNKKKISEQKQDETN